MKDIETRMISSEIRMIEEDNQAPKVTGYAALFNSESEVLFQRGKGKFIERIAPNAFSWQDVRALFNHDSNTILARARGNQKDTLRLTQDNTGLRYEFELDMSNPNAQALHSALKRGDVDQSSFAFSISKEGDKWETRDDGTQIRTILKATVSDVSPVTYPAYSNTTVSVRSYDAWQEEEEKRQAEAVEVEEKQESDAKDLELMQEQLEAEAKIEGIELEKE